VTIIDWNGTDLPVELRNLPAGKYVLARANDSITPEEEDGLLDALESFRTARGVPHDVARDRLLQRVGR